MTLKAKVIYNMTVGLNRDLYARWILHKCLTGQSFNGKIVRYLEADLPPLEGSQAPSATHEEAQP
jgi:hypothetical protein